MPKNAKIPKQSHLRVAGSCKMKFKLVFCPSPCIFYSQQGLSCPCRCPPDSDSLALVSSSSKNNFFFSRIL